MSVFEHYFYGSQFDMLFAGGSANQDTNNLGGLFAINAIYTISWNSWNFGSASF